MRKVVDQEPNQNTKASQRSALPPRPLRKPLGSDANPAVNALIGGQDGLTETVELDSEELSVSETEMEPESNDLQNVEVVSTLAVERELDELLVAMGIRPESRGKNAATVLPLVHEVMSIRTIVAEGDFERLESIKKQIAGLEGTEHRFLLPWLKLKLQRALTKPETAPWALTNAELVSGYDALGGSSEVLQALASVFGPLGGLINEKSRADGISAGNKNLLKAGGRVLVLTSLTALLASVQQAQLRKAYEEELKRRTFGKLDPSSHPSRIRSRQLR